MSAEVDAYLGQFDGEVKARLLLMRKTIQTLAPEAVESLTYGMPAYKLGGKPLVYFAGFSHHIGLYATPNGHEAFKQELTPYKQGKGSVQFPLSKPLPIELIKEIVMYRVKSIG